MVLVDSHCHLDFPELAKKRDEVLTRMRDYEVAYALCVGVNLRHADRVLEVAIHHPHIFAAVGVHPLEKEPFDLERLTVLAKHEKVIAIGETGLDYYRDLLPVEEQKYRLRAHIRLARYLNKPLIIHCREAGEDTIAILQEEKAHEVGGVFHCFTDTLDIAQKALALNFYISFSGIITFRNADNVREVARHIPLEKILIETDSPYLTPLPHRGKPNEPAYVRHVAEKLAEIHAQPLEAIATQTTENFFHLFKEAQLWKQSF